MREKTATDTKQATSVLSRNLAILDALSEGFRLSLAELSAATGFAKPTTHRVLAGLVEEGLVTKDGTFGEYRLTARLSQLAARTDDRILLMDAILAPAKAMTEACQWPVALGLLERGRLVVYFSTRDMTTQTFRPSTLYEAIELTSALGQAALCTMPSAQVARELDGLPDFARGSTARAKLELKLAQTHERGYGLRHGGRGGTTSVALGLTFGNSRVGALVATVFEKLATPKLIHQLAADLRVVHDAAAQHYRLLLRLSR